MPQGTRRKKRPKTAPPRGSWSPDEFCARHKITKPAFYNEIATGRLKTFKIGRLRRVGTDAEAKWLQAREQEAA